MNLFKDWAFYRVFDEQTTLGVVISLRRQFEYDIYFVVTIWKLFVACYATPPRYISLSVCSSVLPSIRPHFFYVFGLTALPQPKCSSNCPCPPVRGCGSRVYGLVWFDVGRWRPRSDGTRSGVSKVSEQERLEKANVNIYYTTWISPGGIVRHWSGGLLVCSIFRLPTSDLTCVRRNDATKRNIQTMLSGSVNRFSKHYDILINSTLNADPPTIV